MTPVLGNATIGRKLFAAFLLLALVAGVVGLVASQRLGQVVSEMEKNARLTADQRKLAHIQVSMLKQLLAERAYILSQELDYLTQHKSHGDEAARALEELTQEAERDGKTDALQPLGALAAKNLAYSRIFEEVAGLMTSKLTKEAVALSLTQSGPQADELSREDVEAVPALSSGIRAEFLRGMVKSERGFVLLLDLELVLSATEQEAVSGVLAPRVAEAAPAARAPRGFPDAELGQPPFSRRERSAFLVLDPPGATSRSVAALAVEAVMGMVEIGAGEIDELPTFASQAPAELVEGAALSSGQPMLILDLPALLAR